MTGLQVLIKSQPLESFNIRKIFTKLPQLPYPTSEAQ
ncbi:hypothetical protein ZPR_3436 [Zunongwangia profunda SM-A87]|uniref:Uncharacterized protein n=1 Tax=Zunongwangia profunda (strain DSM 18752 / CCTCC AB 206139 / SM-A87) TaxID=655815 RepID=D5BJQ4_ZUNPS|nr:hypothetical protein ZPR_3436 [Zunongwangia profunda SM-A87]